MKKSSSTKQVQIIYPQSEMREAVDFKFVAAKQLNQEIREHARIDKENTANLIARLAECERRKTYLEEGFRSLWDFLTQGLGYSDAEAGYRFHAARLALSIPEVKDEIESGRLTLTQAAKVERVIRKEEKSRGQKFNTSLKKEVVQKVIGKTIKETEKVLIEELQITEPLGPRVIEKQKANGQVEFTLTVSKELAEELERMKEHFSHKAPGADLVEVIEIMVSQMKKKSYFSRAAKRVSGDTGGAKHGEIESLKPVKTSNPEPCSQIQKSIPVATKRFVYQRDQGRCQHRKPDGSLCGSRYQVQIDHKVPKFAGGGNGEENLQLLCSTHNQEKYRRQAGLRWK